MNELTKFIVHDIEQKKLIERGLRRVGARQTILIMVGILILIMFGFNYFQNRAQQKKEDKIIEMLNDVARAGRLVIESQDKTIDSMIVADSLRTK